MDRACKSIERRDGDSRRTRCALNDGQCRWNADGEIRGSPNYLRKGRRHRCKIIRVTAIQCRNSVLTGWKGDCPAYITRCVHGKCGRGDLARSLTCAKRDRAGRRTRRHATHMRCEDDWRTARRWVHGRRHKSRCVRLLDNLPVRDDLLRIEGRRDDADSTNTMPTKIKMCFIIELPFPFRCCPLCVESRALPDKKV